MTAAERALGRFLRAPDGHDPAPADPPADPSAAPDPTILNNDPTPADPPADPKAADLKAADPAPAEPATVPEKYELTVPDGFEGIDSDVLAEATPVLKELNLTNEQADKLTPIAAQLVKKTMDRAEQAVTDRAIQNRKDWAEAFDKDEKIGGANKEQTIKDAAKAFDHYGLKKGEGLRLLLDESGLGNHPDLIRFVSAVGRDLAEGTHDRGSHVTTPKTPEGALYGPEFQPKG
ncbi:hypothetical protein [Sphingomonas sp. URHD0057]|uniref:hypothetical protein n=1 Tax=Sphingomonas sp. URHD0057 TaxID=1380389 RepID=UPI00048A6619|nr:hypothetical protein [Sphingomonas sp. URHD0057]